MTEQRHFGRKEISLILVALAWFYALAQYEDPFTILPVLLLLVIASIVAGYSPFDPRMRQRYLYFAPVIFLVLSYVVRILA